MSGKLIGAKGAGRPRKVDALDRLCIGRLTGERGVSAELVGAVFGLSAAEVCRIAHATHDEIDRMTRGGVL